MGATTAMRRKAAVVWVGLCVVIFLLMFNAPVQGARAPEGYWYQCPSLPTIIRLGPNPSLSHRASPLEKRFDGIGLTRTYFQCRSAAATRWAAASVLLPTLLCLGGFTYARRVSTRARVPE